MKKKKNSNKTPVVLQVIPELGPGGAEQGCIDVCAGLVKAGVHAYVVSHGGSRVHEIARAGGTHIDMPVHSKNPLVMAKNVQRLKNLIRKYDVDIVHVRSRAPAWSAYKACKQTGAHFMTTCHAPYNISGKAKLYYNSVMARGERIIAISHYVADYLRINYRTDPAKIRVIHRGIALERFHPTTVTAERLIRISKEWRLPDGAPVILLPGRITRLKGHAILIEAMAKLGRNDVICVLLGADQGRVAYRKELEDLIKEKGLEGQMRIVDHCDDMAAAYMLSTVVVSASTDPEGFGRVPVEAQAMGRPIIATDHGGPRESIVRGETGWLIPPADADSLATAIHEALNLLPGQRAILATRAMAHIARNFTREQMISRTLAVYNELLEVDRTALPIHLEEKKDEFSFGNVAE